MFIDEMTEEEILSYKKDHGIKVEEYINLFKCPQYPLTGYYKLGWRTHQDSDGYVYRTCYSCKTVDRIEAWDAELLKSDSGYVCYICEDD